MLGGVAVYPLDQKGNNNNNNNNNNNDNNNEICIIQGNITNELITRSFKIKDIYNNY